MSPFVLKRPTRGHFPVLVEVPHASIVLPSAIESQLAAPKDCLWRDADLHVDKLYDGVEVRGATLLTAKYSRYAVDLNRAPDDIDRSTVPDHPSPKGTQPRGVVWRLTTDGHPIWKNPLRFPAFAERLALFHTPYHATLGAELRRLREEFGYVLMIAAHSMPSVGRSGHTDAGSRRADVVPGTRGRTSADARMIDLVDAHFRAAGLSVVHDDPYRGGWTTQHYGRPLEKQHVVQIELNRAIYMNEDTGAIRDREFENLSKIVHELVSKLCELRV